MIENSERFSKAIDLLHKSNKRQVGLKQYLAGDKDRFHQFSRSFEGILLDFSRVAIDSDDFMNLMDLASASGVEDLREQMFAGAQINFTEQRAVLHPLWRKKNFSDLLSVDEAKVLNNASDRMRGIAQALHQGYLPGDASQGPITDTFSQFGRCS
jgi:glucose-6-phosphate isomerase